MVLAGPLTGGQPATSVGSYTTHEQAQHAVSFLADNDFPIDRVSIVGSDLRLVETVLGRLTPARSALGGAGTGAWIGLLAGLISGMAGAGAASLLAIGMIGALFGAAFGAVFGLAAHASTRKLKGLVSHSNVVAQRYEVLVPHDLAEEARNLLIKHEWRTS
ncbi:unnamed protein product [[Actinomadura] parvosata subsp. kistnae]|uniref:General stress protein 17M-like domain-containing protein n=1 Tax=[Actinomadura] parvosata subsp. kistnae TaxID=1909395 RepID=A0A1V0A1E0_9ACTN|nr:general stress protein [Nonomuraea sp. ATCC 55076]AQZ64010.1 hypothetical protein BKM31_23380 [Nonomuraea sp. ATCC 55076]SPL89889.1 unnamed protein product [Actinomadura parvosata subsp. kistnae]